MSEVFTEGLYGCYLIEQRVFGANDEEFWENEPTRRIFNDVTPGASPEEALENLRRFLEESKDSSSYCNQKILDGQQKTEKILYPVAEHCIWRHFEIAPIKTGDLAPVASTQVTPLFLAGFTDES